jgi:hypothetical protein
MLISSAVGLENVHRPVRKRNLWRELQHLKPLAIDRNKALVNTVSMKAIAEERKGYLGKDWRLGGLVEVVDFVHWLIIDGLGKSLLFLVRIRRG